MWHIMYSVEIYCSFCCGTIDILFLDSSADTDEGTLTLTFIFYGDCLCDVCCCCYWYLVLLEMIFSLTVTTDDGIWKCLVLLMTLIWFDCISIHSVMMFIHSDLGMFLLPFSVFGTLFRVFLFDCCTAVPFCWWSDTILLCIVTLLLPFFIPFQVLCW
jgi:hypothetical protein